MSSKVLIYRIFKIVLLIIVTFNLIAFIGVHAAHNEVFSRADYDDYDSSKYLTYNDIDSVQYPREALKINSEENVLTGFLYGADSTKGIIVVSPGHRDANDIKLYEIMYFVDAGWMVLSFDYTGCYNSEGKSMVGYVQAPKDLNAVLSYVETEARFDNMPILLFGHSLGAYASTAVLQYNHNVAAVVATSGFDNPKEQWEYSVKRSTGIFGNLLKPYAGMYMDMKFRDEAHLSAIDGINSTDIPVLIISGTDDEFYGGESKLYKRQHEITNKNCEFLLMDKEGHNGHYNYFLTAEALEYQKKINSGGITELDKSLYMEHDKEFLEYINSFYLRVIRNN